MSKVHTPGPWRFDQEEMKIKGTDDVNFYTVIANVSPKMDYSRGMTTQCANAKLIAAAPEMLEALIILESGLRKDIDMYSIEEKLSIAQKAIKKATG